MEPSFYIWIFSEKNHIYAAYDNEQVVGGYCLLEIDCLVNGHPKKGLLCNNIFVNGFRYQKLGVFQELTEYALYKNNNHYDIALGFPNSKATRAHLRAGWNLGQHLSISELSTDQLKLGASINTASETLSEDNLDSVHDKFLSLSKDPGGFRLVKTKEYLNWRFLQNHRYHYFVSMIKDSHAFIIWKYFKERQRIHIMDLYIEDAQQLSDLTAEAVNHTTSQKLSVEFVDMWTPPCFSKQVAESGFIEAEVKQPVIINSLRRELNMELSSAYLSLSDNDVY